MGGLHDKNKKTLSAWIQVDKRDALRELARVSKVSVADLIEQMIDERINQIRPVAKEQVRKKNKNKK